MELSAELFEQTIRSFKGDIEASKKQRRAQPRVGIRCHLKIVPVVDGKPAAAMEVCTRDISRSGIGLISSQKITIGDRFVLRLPREGESLPMGLVCTVRCCNQLSPGVFAIGAVFEGTDKLSAEAA
jgi:hypothetical protein